MDMQVLIDQEASVTKLEHNNGCLPPVEVVTRFPRCFAAAVVVSAFVMPFVAILYAALLYSAQDPPMVYLPWRIPTPIVDAVIVATVTWLVAAGLCCVLGFTSVRIANASSFAELDRQSAQYRSRLEVVTSELVQNGAAYHEAWEHYRQFLWDVSHPSVHWVLGTGYIALLGAVHRMGEALLEVDPYETVLGEALYDEQRLQGSQIEGSSHLLARLRAAVAVLYPTAVRYLSEVSQPGTDLSLNGAQKNPLDHPNRSCDRQAEARVVLREVRRTINEYRRDYWNGLVRKRNQLLWAVFLTGLATYVVFAVVLSIVDRTGTSKDVVLTAIVFYLVGALVGLFSRLYSESGGDSSIEDYGVSMTRVVLTPLLSGIAAVGGVLLLPWILPGSGSLVPKALQLEDINSFRLVLAAIFGLAPSLLLGILQQETDKYKMALKSSGSAGRPSA
jgi:hypothetical protein